MATTKKTKTKKTVEKTDTLAEIEAKVSKKGTASDQASSSKFNKIRQKLSVFASQTKQGVRAKNPKTLTLLFIAAASGLFGSFMVYNSFALTGNPCPNICSWYTIKYVDTHTGYVPPAGTIVYARYSDNTAALCYNGSNTRGTGKIGSGGSVSFHCQIGNGKQIKFSLIGSGVWDSDNNHGGYLGQLFLPSGSAGCRSDGSGCTKYPLTRFIQTNTDADDWFSHTDYCPTIRGTDSRTGGCPPPIITAFTLNGTNGNKILTKGSTLTIAWASNYTRGCTATGKWTGSLAVSGSQNRSTDTANIGTFTYSLHCTSKNGALVYGPISRTLTVTAAPPTPTEGPLYRLWNGNYKDHMYTTNPDEVRALTTRATNKWIAQGDEGKIYLPQTNGTCATGYYPLYQLWNGRILDHMYTSSASEKSRLTTRATDRWTYQRIVGCSAALASVSSNVTQESCPSTAGVELWRLWSPTYTEHMYTSDTSEVAMLTTRETNRYVNQGVESCLK